MFIYHLFASQTKVFFSSLELYGDKNTNNICKLLEDKTEKM